MDTPSNVTGGTAELRAQTEGALLNADQASRYLGLSISFIRKAVASNRIPFVRIGTRTLFQRDALNRWIDAHAIQTRGEIASQAEGIAAATLLRR